MPYRIVFFDIDGTLINEERRIPSSTKDSIQKLRQNNVEVSIATGRAPCQFEKIANELEIDSFVSCNGSCVVYKGKTIYEHPIPRNSLEKLVDASRQHEHPLVFAGRNDCYSNYSQHPHVIESFCRLNLDFTPNYDPDYWQDTDIFQVYLYCQQHEETFYAKNADELTMLRASHLYMDVFPQGGSKAVGLEAMLNYLGLSASNAVAFGDGLNDKEMLAFAGMGIAMGNAHKELLPYANFTTRNVSEGGIPFGLRKIGLI